MLHQQSATARTLAGLAGACQRGRQRRGQGGAIAAARRYAAPWCPHRPEAVASFYAEDGRIVVNDGEPFVGREGIAAFPDLVLRMDLVRCSGTHALYRWTPAGTNSGAGGSRCVAAGPRPARLPARTGTSGAGF